MSTIATTIAGPKTYSAEELQALHLAMNAKAKRKKILSCFYCGGQSKTVCT